jgi:hypothetical protein
MEFSMRIDIDREHLLTFNQAAKSLQHPVAPSSIWRWARRGLQGIYLESVLIGGTRFTSSEAISRFAAALTAASEPMNGDSHSDAKSERDESTNRGLKAAGLT